MNFNNWGKFTVRGTEEVEKLITSMVSEIAEEFERNLKDVNYEALAMMGGYGRGEGGVVISDGVEKPHNNFDFVLLTNNMNDEENTALKKKIMGNLEPIINKIKIGIDLSVTSASKLKHASCRIIWYDMRFGHKTILGNKDFVPSLTHFTIPKIPDWDARNLLVNRGTLMIINDLLLEKQELDENFKKLIVKHIVKAIIGYGDTLLYFLDDYDWSYVEKQKRMRNRNDVDVEFKEIYDEAMNFRFQPTYDDFMKRDFTKWMDKLRVHFERIFLFCESKRLKKKDLNWDNYADTAFKFALSDEMFKCKPFAKKVIYFLKSKSYPGHGSLGSKLGFKTLDDAGVLPILFPLFAYHLENDYYREIAAKFLGSQNREFRNLRKAYLNYWGRTGDVNFINILTKYEISLNAEA